MTIKFDFALTDLYTDRITNLNDTLKAIAKLNPTGSTSLESGMFRFYNNKIEQYNGSAWSDVTLTNSLSTLSISVDTISEKTSANGVIIDGVTLKDGGGTFTGDIINAGYLLKNTNDDLNILGAGTVASASNGGYVAVYGYQHTTIPGSVITALGRNNNNAYFALFGNDGAGSGVERLRVTADGKVGIGGNPIYRVDSKSPISYEGINGNFNANNTSGSAGYVFSDNGLPKWGITNILGSGSLIFYRNSGSLGLPSWNNYLEVTSDGNVGIGGTPLRKLDVQDSTFYTQAVFGDKNAIYLFGGSLGVFRQEHVCFNAEYNSSLWRAGRGAVLDTNGYGGIVGFINSTGDFVIHSSTNQGDAGTALNMTRKLTITSDGKISTGGETSPDVTSGGLCLKETVSSSNNIFSIKSYISDAHSTTYLEETDTIFSIKRMSGYASGVEMTAISGVWTGLYITSVASNESTETSAGNGTACFQIDTCKSSGTGITSFGSDGNMIIFSNNAANTHIFKGDGDIYTSTGTITPVYDSEDDIKLVETVRNTWDRKEVIEKYQSRLEELGILKNGFMSHNKMISLNLGAIGQLYNIIRKMAVELGYSESQLLEFAKEY